MREAAESTTVSREVELDATLDEVWSALTDPEELTAWLGAEVELDLRPAGGGRVVDRDGTVRDVLVTDVEPGRRLAWHWWDDRGELSSVEVTVEQLVDATRVRVMEVVAASSPAAGTARASALTYRWSSRLGSLRAVRAGAPIAMR